MYGGCRVIQNELKFGYYNSEMASKTAGNSAQERRIVSA